MAVDAATQFTPGFVHVWFWSRCCCSGTGAFALDQLPDVVITQVKFLPMECGQMPTGEGRSHFMMQYYSYILMFVVFDVMAIFLYVWAASLFSIPRIATLPIMAFLGIMFAAMGYALYLSGRKGIW